MWKCWAYRENGNICGEPANYIDSARGYTVCTQHRRKENSVDLFEKPLFPELPVTVKSLEFRLIDIKTACYLNYQWHSILPEVIPTNIWRSRFSIAFVLLFKAEYVGVAIYSAPVNQYLDDGETLELRRLALSEVCPKNSATYFMARCEKQIKIELPVISRLISYQDTQAHRGTIYKAGN